jgi:hypothetical protein
MSISLVALPLRRKRDVFVARQRARQLARLLGYEPPEQVSIAAAVFELAARACAEKRRPTIRFQVSRSQLHVFCEPEASLRLLRSLPEEARRMPLEDLAWAAQELNRQTPLDLFEEVQRQNQELLRVIQELHECRGELEQRKDRQRGAAA